MPLVREAEQRGIRRHGVAVDLPSGMRIQAVPPAFLLATKLEAYLGRGQGDLLASRDWTDIVALVDGREELSAEIRGAPAELVEYLGETLRTLLAEERIVEGVQAQLRPDANSQARAEEVVLKRINEIVGPGDTASGRMDRGRDTR